MKGLFTILFCLFSLLCLAQYKGVVKQVAEAYQFKALLPDSALGLPRYDHKPTPNEIRFKGRRNDAYVFMDTLHNIAYTYNPHTNTVDPLGGGTTTITGGSGTVLNPTVVTDGSTQDIIIPLDSSLNVVSVIPTTKDGSGTFTSTQSDNQLILHYAQAPEGTITYKISVLGKASGSNDTTTTVVGGGGGNTGGGNTDTTGNTGGGSTPLMATNSAWTYTNDLSCPVTYGANFTLGNSANMVALANTGLTSARVPYNGTGTATYPIYTAGGYNVLLSYNPAPPVAGSFSKLPNDTLAYRNSLNTFLNSNGTTNLTAIASFNEEGNIKNGTGYWNPGSAKNAIALIRTNGNVAHEHGLKATNGGFSGEIFYYEVWKDFINTGHADSAAAFAAAVFPAGTNLTTWATDTAHGYRITYMDSIISAIDSLPLDYVNIHIGLTIRDVDSANATINVLPFRQMVRYLRRVSGRPVISNEITFPNNSNTDILSQIVDAIETIHNANNGDMSIVQFYNTDNHPFVNSDGSLTTFGLALKQKLAETHIN